MGKKQHGFGIVEIISIVAILILAGFIGWYIFTQNARQNTNTNPTPSPETAQDTPTASDPYEGWKTYTWQSEKVTFKYPVTWFIEEDQTSGRVYVRTTQTSVTKDDQPQDYQAVWLSVGAQETSLANEQSVKNGEPQGRQVSGAITTASITAQNLTIATYEYQTIGGATLQAFWSNAMGKRFYATNATEVGEENQKMMVATLKKILASIQ